MSNSLFANCNSKSVVFWPNSFLAWIMFRNLSNSKLASVSCNSFSFSIVLVASNCLIATASSTAFNLSSFAFWVSSFALSCRFFSASSFTLAMSLLNLTSAAVFNLAFSLAVYSPAAISRLVFSKFISACFLALASSSLMESNKFCCSALRMSFCADLRLSLYSFAFAAFSFAACSSSASNFFCSRLNNLRLAANSVSAFATWITASLIAFLLSSVWPFNRWSSLAAANRFLANCNSLVAKSVSLFLTWSNAFFLSTNAAFVSDNNSRACANSLFCFARSSFNANSWSSNWSWIATNLPASFAVSPNNPPTNSNAAPKPSANTIAISWTTLTTGRMIPPNTPTILFNASMPSSVDVNALYNVPNIAANAANTAPMGFATNAIIDWPNPFMEDATPPIEPGNASNLLPKLVAVSPAPPKALLAFLPNESTLFEASSTPLVLTLTL